MEFFGGLLKCLMMFVVPVLWWELVLLAWEMPADEVGGARGED